MLALTQQKHMLVEASNRIMATDVSIHLAVPPAQEKFARVAIQAGMNWMHEVEQRLTRFDENSELCQLNDAAGRWQPTSAMLFTVMREAVAAAEKSGGLFDPTLLPQLEALGYDRDFSLLHRQANHLAESVYAASEASWRGIEFDAPRRRVLLPQGTRLDLGGIAKGWAADVALKRFFQPFDNVIINVGGDLRQRGGPQPGESWTVGIRDPRTDHLPTGDNIAIVRVGQGGLATSGASRRWWYQGGQRQHHLLDPRTGRPASIWMPPSAENAEGADAAQLIATATALAPTAAQAEVAAKVALLRGYPAALEAVEAAWNEGRAHQTEGVALLLVIGNGQIVLSANMNEYLAICGAGGIIWG
ncbi:MAG TPA: FAD:protein FMN transferase [Ktedonobacterales bacterium]|nr:FAD:protein FMN transferase [Ktedonobacterales bacterium]